MPDFHKAKKKFTPGDPLLEAVDADWLNSVEARLNRLDKLQVVPPLRKHESGFGTVLSIRTPPGTGGGSELLRARVRFNFCSTDEVFSVCNVEFYGNFTGVTPTTINNVLALAGERGMLIQAVYRKSTKEWDIVNIQHVDREYLEKMEVDKIVSASGGGDPDLVSSGGDADVQCKYNFRRLSTPMIKAPLSGENPEPFQCDANSSSSSSGGDSPNICVVEQFDTITFKPKSVLTSLSVDGFCVMANVEVVWYPDQCVEDSELIEQFCGADCPSSSSGL